MFKTVNRDTDNGKFDWLIDEYFERNNSYDHEDDQFNGIEPMSKEEFDKPAEPVLCPWTGTVLNP